MFSFLSSFLLLMGFSFLIFLGVSFYRNILKNSLDSEWKRKYLELEENRKQTEEELRAFQRGLDLPFYNRKALQDELWNRANLGDENSYYILVELLNSEISEDSKSNIIDIQV